MKQIRSFLSLIVALCLAMTAFIPAMAEETTAEAVEVAASDEFEIATALGILSKDNKPGDAVSRGAAVSIALRLTGIEAVKGSPMPFIDVPTGHAYAAEIATASVVGMVNGVGGSEFRPDEPVELDAFLKMMIIALGYKVVAEDGGGFPYGYLSVAAEKNLLDGISADTVTYNIAAGIAVNAFDIPLLEVDYYTYEGAQSYREEGKTVLDNMDVVEIKGRVTKNTISSLQSPRNSISRFSEIDGFTVLTPAGEVDPYLGYNVRAYVAATDDENERILYYAKPYNNNEFILDGIPLESAVVSFATNVIEYQTDTGKHQKLRLSPEAEIIFNGVASAERSEAVILPENGKTVFVDSDRDDVYECILVESYRDFLVDRVNVASEIIYDKFGKKLEISDEKADIVFIKDESGANVSLSSITEWKILSVKDSGVYAMDGIRAVEITVSSKAVSGTLEDAEKDDEDTYYTVDGVKYKRSADYINSASSEVIEPKVGDSGTFYVTVRGEIIGFSQSSIEDLKNRIGFLVDAAMEKGLSGKAKMKIYVANSGMQIMELKDKVRLDAQNVKQEDIISQFENGVITPDVIRYRLDENGLISDIDTVETTVDEGKNSLIRQIDSRNNGLVHHNVIKSFGEKIIVDTTSTIFEIPVSAEGVPSYDDIKTVTLSAFQHDANYKISAYATNTDAILSSVMVHWAPFGTTTMAISDMFLVSGVKTVLDEDRNEVEAVTGLGKNGEKTYYSGGMIFGANDIEKGDIILCTTDSSGDVTEVEIIFDISADVKHKPVDEINATHTGELLVYYVYDHDGYCISTVPTDTDMSLITDSRALDKSLLSLLVGNAAVYDADTEIVRKATIDDLMTYRDNPGKQSYILYTAAGDRFVVLYNNMD